MCMGYALNYILLAVFITFQSANQVWRGSSFFNYCLQRLQPEPDLIQLTNSVLMWKAKKLLTLAMIAISTLQVRDSLITETDILWGTVIAWSYIKTKQNKKIIVVHKVYSKKQTTNHYDDRKKISQSLKQL